MGIIQAQLAAGRAEISVLVHHTGEGGGEGSYDAAAGACGISFANTGVFTGSKSTSTATSPYNWLVSGLAADAEIFFHQVSGTAVTGATLDTWLVLSSTRALSLAWPGGAGSSSAVVQVSIRDRVSGTVKVSAVSIAMATHP
jgi:hypothetical protein